MDMLRAIDLQFDYVYENEAPQVVLQGVNLTIRKGAFVAILGHNGCGKSTLSKHFNALLLPTGGKVLVAECVKLLSDDPLFFLINSYTTGLSPSVMQYVLGTLLPKNIGGSLSADEIGLPVTVNGMVLPCGATAMWCK